MRTASLRNVLEQFNNGKTPSAQEVSARTGLSLPTVYRALSTLGATPDDQWPARYSVKPTDAEDAIKQEASRVRHRRTRLSAAKTEGMPRMFVQTLVPQFKVNQPKYTLLIGKLLDNPRHSVEDYAKVAQQISDDFADMAHTLREVSEDPDWYTRLGGEL